MQGVIVKALSGFYYVKTDSETVECRARGRFRLDGSSPLVGDRVEIETQTSRVLSAAVLVYIVPFVLFFIGYAIAAALKMSEGYSMLMSFGFFAVGFVVIALVGRSHKKNPITYEITNIIGCGAESV